MLRISRLFALASLAFVSFVSLSQMHSVEAITFPYSQTFDTDVANISGSPAYPEFTLTSGFGSVSGGTLYLNNGVSTGTNILTFPSVSTTPGLSTDIVMEVDMGGINIVSGSSRVEVKLGGVNALFHPGYPQGAFRFEGAVSQSNTNMGFTPAAGVLHHFTARSYGNGQFDVSIRNGSNPLQVFNAAFNNLASVGQTFGLRYLANGQGIFDNLSIHYAADLVDNSANSVFDVTPGINTDAIQLSNGGLNASVLNVTGFSISGADAGLFSLTDFAPTSLTVGGSNSVSFDVAYTGGLEGLRTALLTLNTNIGDFEFTLSAQAAPEPSSLVLLGLGAVVVARRRRKNGTAANV